jgi:hypothetical protein
MPDNYQLVKSIAVTLVRGLKEVPLTTALIGELVDRSLVALASEWSPGDREDLVRDLETQFNVWIGKPRTLEDATDHKPWLPQKRGQIKWRYWDRYKLLLADRWPAASIDRLEEITDEILMRIEDPSREGAWDRRGLIVGHVQSGKTANYIGLINKAVDAGYRVIVVLAGVHKSLRSQTQIRLDEGFLGYESVAAVAANQGLKTVGVGRIAPGLRPDTITNRTDDGDFKRTVAERFQINPGGNPLLFVIKKNASVLRNLLEWVEWAANSKDSETGRPVVRNVPLLVIDDEADHASVDTKEQSFDENGNPDPDYDPTVINRRIRRLLHSFEKVAYVGYTATPFANIYIHECGKTRDEGEDLFPRSFIINLPAPSDYVGPLRVFGIDAHPEAELNAVGGLPILRRISDHEELNEDRPLMVPGWMPSRHNKAHVPRYGGEELLPPSLQEAIRAFLLACAARRARGQVAVHNSMLIHVTRYTDVQEKVFSQVKTYVDHLLLRLKYGEGEAADPEIGRLHELWERDFEPTTEAVGGGSASWVAIEKELWNAASAIQLKRVNGTAPDILDYESHRHLGLSVIAIGGDKLARGLTLEGLTVSYFLRAAKMYDTLMQMGRWFGYRPGYLDLCRMYMTDDLEDWFRHITAANEELRQEFDRMAAVGGTPRDYGLRVKSHPALLITSRVKMRHGTELDLSFAGDITETTVFNVDERSTTDNLATVNAFIQKLGEPIDSPSQDRPGGKTEKWVGTYLWNDVAADAVAGFLRKIVTSELARKVNGKLMAQFIENASSNAEITSWCVALVGKAKGTSWSLPALNKKDLFLIERHGGFPSGPRRFNIQRVLNPRDEAIDLNCAEYGAALAATKTNWSPDGGRSRSRKEPEIPSGPMIRQQRHKSRALMLLYLLDHDIIASDARECGAELPPPMPLVGFAVSFPADATVTTVRYRVNNIYWEQEYGNAA